MRMTQHWEGRSFGGGGNRIAHLEGEFLDFVIVIQINNVPFVQPFANCEGLHSTTGRLILFNLSCIMRTCTLAPGCAAAREFNLKLFVKV